MPRSTELDAVAQDGNGTGVREETKQEKGLITKLLNLVHKYCSSNQVRELSAGELNGREKEAREVT